MIDRIVEFLNEYLRINAIRRVFTLVEVRWTEVAGLVALALAFALFEGIGLSMLLPILQFAESGQPQVLESSGAIWVAVSDVMAALNLPPTLPVLLAFAFVPVLMRQVVFYANAWYSAVVAGRIGFRMRTRAFDAVMDADPEFFTRHALGRIVGVVVTQTGAAGQAILAVMRQFSLALLMMLYVAMLFVLSAPLTLIIVVFAGIVSVAIKAAVAKISQFGTEAAAVNQSMTGKIVERLAMVQLIKLRDQKAAESSRVQGFSNQMRDISVKQARLGASIEVTADPVMMLGIFVTLYIGITSMGMSLAELGLLLFVLNRLSTKLKEFNAGRQAISTNMAGLVLVRQMVEEAEESNTIRRGPLKFTGLTQEIRLDDVSYEYPDTFAPDGTLETPGKHVLKGVSLTIPAGSFTALVGRSGSGKSTLAELLPRLRDASSGAISFDGADIKEFDVGTLRKGIGFLTQSALLFNESVRDNLVYGLDFEPTDDQIRSALERAHAAFVYALPHGLDTMLGDRGVRFSGGERQRIGLARVLLEDCSVLVLDEPTSALDSESESYIQDALTKLHGKKTIIVIAHRLATVKQADQLVVLDDGRIMERGTHDELVAKGDAYQRLFESQLL